MDHLLTEAANPASHDLDQLTPLEFVRLMNAEDAKVAPAVAAEADKVARAIEIIADRFQRGGRLVYAGAGTSGRLGVLDASECPPTFQSPPAQVVGIIAGGPQALTTAVEGAEDHPEFASADLESIHLSADDVLVGIATSGRTPYVLGALRRARSVGAVPIGLACVADSELTPLCDFVIAPLVGSEVLTGSTRLKAGTATKLVLNMLTTGAMVRVGKTYGNLMVDLRATNVKLRARTNRIVRHFTQLSVEQADQLLQRCDGELKTAILAQRLGVDAVTARKCLAEAHGRVRVALAGPSAPTVPDPDLILGVDGGGSHTTVLLARLGGDRFEIIGTGRSGPSNLRSVGEPAALRALDHAVARAFENANLPCCPVGAAVFGLAGAGREAERRLVANWACQRQIANPVQVVSDSSLLLEMLPEHWGIAVVAGTGSAVWGRTPDGREARAGGWGPVLGDEGSAYRLTLAALQSVARQHDGREDRTALFDLMLDAMGLQSADQIVPAIHGGDWDRTRLAELARVVLAACEQRDESARSIVEQGASELALQVAAVAKTLALPASPVAFAGGLLIHEPAYRDRVLHHLHRIDRVPASVQLITEPAEGALRLATKRIKRPGTS